MNVTIEIPERIADALSSKGADVQRRVLEMLVIDGYQTGDISRGQVGEMLSLSFQETEEFLHQHQVERVTVAEYEQDAETFREHISNPLPSVMELAGSLSSHIEFTSIQDEKDAAAKAWADVKP